jgi:hypothetical protein
MKARLTIGAVALLASAVAFAQQAGEKKDEKLYTVVDGNKVDEKTLEGWRTWRSLACERCHGPNQEGMVGPSLIDSLKRMTPEEFKTSVLKGRPEKGMPNFDTSEQAVKNIDGLYAYLKGRSTGDIKPGRLQPIEK